MFLFMSVAGAQELYVKNGNWIETMLLSRQALSAAHLPAAEEAAVAAQFWLQIKEDFPVQWDWSLQDGGTNFAGWFRAGDNTSFERRMTERVIGELGDSSRLLRQGLEELRNANVPASDRRWLELYVKACEQRRQQRLRSVLAHAPRIVFTKHRTIRASSVAYSEGQSDAQAERYFLPGSELCLLEMDGLYGRVRSLQADPTGAIRDPAVSWDGQRVLFAWKKSLEGDDYHLYELNVASNEVRQITSGLGVADYEPAWLPNGDIIFSSTRCVQTVGSWWSEVSNLYTCDADGRFLRRVGFDQAHTLYPQVLEDGRVIYTRWDYNDRGQTFARPLFQMYPDGTGQTAFYGNDSWFPATIAHARGIPGTQNVLAILCGYHTPQAGKLAIIDPAKGRQENTGLQLVAPVRDTPAERAEVYGQAGELWQYPCPLNDRECITAYAPLGWNLSGQRKGDADFGIYWMSFDGRRELLAADGRLPCTQPMPLTPRPAAFMWANRVDYAQRNGTYYLQDIYCGPGLAGVPRGTIKKLRVVALEFRAAGVGFNGSFGPGGSAVVSTPISIGNGAWDVKTVLGEARVYEDGSALFTVPARTPVYFQALDERGCAVQTMRSWSTLQPGEYFSCVGCHESKNTAPPTENHGFSMAMKAGAQPLEPFFGPPRGFSFAREIQPILDRHCIRCHKDREPLEQRARGEIRMPVFGQTPSPRASGDGAQDELAFSLLGEEFMLDRAAERKWSDAYVVLTQAELASGAMGNPGGRVVNWAGSQSPPEMPPPYSAGSGRSELLTMLERGHQGVRLSFEEMEKIACWIDLLVPYCGDYLEANAWQESEMRRYQQYTEKRRRMEEAEQDNLRDLLGSKEPGRRPPRAMIPPAPRGY